MLDCLLDCMEEQRAQNAQQHAESYRRADVNKKESTGCFT